MADATRSAWTAQSEPAIEGVSDWTQLLRTQIERFAPFNSNVLISGPSGTGKELIARSLHALSPRAANRFVPVDCATMTGELMASQLFGHLAGAFTGANHASLGCFRAAHSGTIFLDEIGEMELPLQAKLLRVLQERVVTPVGGYEGIPVDVRVVAATNRDLEKEVCTGRFREDLFYRLNVVSVTTLALAERPEDISALSASFLSRLARDGMPRKGISIAALDLLERFSWPGNVRQLKNVLEQAVVGCDGPQLTREDMQNLLRGQVGTVRPSAITPFGSADDSEEAFVAKSDHFRQTTERKESSQHRADAECATLQVVERQHLLRVLEHTYYNRAAASRLLGISRQSLLRKMKKQQIEVPPSRRS